MNSNMSRLHGGIGGPGDAPGFVLQNNFCVVGAEAAKRGQTESLRTPCPFPVRFAKKTQAGAAAGSRAGVLLPGQDDSMAGQAFSGGADASC